MESQKVFSEAEVGDLIRRAAELQEANAEGSYTPGVTSDELKRIASEAGIDPKYLERAIQQKAQTPPNQNKLITIEKVLPVELAPENFDAITEKVTPINSSTPQAGTSVMTQIGRSLQGQVKGGWSNPHIKVTSREGRTKMCVRAESSIAAAMAIGWSVPLMLTPLLAKTGTPILAATAAAACVVAAFFNYKWGVRKANQTTTAVAEKIESAILEAGSLRENIANAKSVTLESETAQKVDA
ncbi:MAG: hypothetical protein H7Y17_02620 [Chlorobia bacterium]|nr:hypothetical protein [Fimbriimonadaceae bacterium]